MAEIYKLDPVYNDVDYNSLVDVFEDDEINEIII